MGQLEYQDTDLQSELAPDTTVADLLRSAVERRVRNVVEEAVASARAIQDRAEAHAEEIEEEAQRKANGMLKTSIDRAEAMFEAIDTLQTEMTYVIATFFKHEVRKLHRS